MAAYHHPWTHLVPLLSNPPPQKHFSALTDEFVQDLCLPYVDPHSGCYKPRTNSSTYSPPTYQKPTLNLYLPNYQPPVTSANYTTLLVLNLLRTPTIYPDHLCQELRPSSPLWIALLVSNTIKLLHPDFHQNSHIHPIEPVSLIEFIPTDLLNEITKFYHSTWIYLL
jgi:hypothetical protein